MGTNSSKAKAKEELEFLSRLEEANPGSVSPSTLLSAQKRLTEEGEGFLCTSDSSQKDVQQAQEAQSPSDVSSLTSVSEPPKSRRGRPKKRQQRRSKSAASSSDGYRAGGLSTMSTAFHAERDLQKEQKKSRAAQRQRRSREAKRVSQSHELSKADEMTPAQHSVVSLEIRKSLENST